MNGVINLELDVVNCWQRLKTVYQYFSLRFTRSCPLTTFADKGLHSLSVSAIFFPITSNFWYSSGCAPPTAFSMNMYSRSSIARKPTGSAECLTRRWECGH